MYDRAWILPRWRQHLAEWEEHGVELRFGFVVHQTDYETVETVMQFAPSDHLDVLAHGGRGDHRGWQHAHRIKLLAEYRNDLRWLVRHYWERWEVDYFLSLDSDILVSPWEESQLLFNSLQGKDGVSPLAYLGERESNAFTRPLGPEKPARRIKPLDALQQADILCAAILMNRQLATDPRVEYGFHPLGEDFFWSAAAKANRYDLALDSRVKWKHVMRREMLDQVDRRIGW